MEEEWQREVENVTKSPKSGVTIAKKVANIVLDVVVVAVLLLALFTIVVTVNAKKGKDGTATIFGYQLRFVQSGSMGKCAYTDVSKYKVKSIKVKSCVFIKTAPTDVEKIKEWYKTLKVGDVLTFQYNKNDGSATPEDYEGDSKVITHRVIKIEKKENAKNEYQNLEVKNMSITLTATQTNATEYPFKSVSSSSGSLTVSEPVYASGEWGAVKATKSAQITVEADVKAVEKDHGAVAVWASGNSKVIINGGYFSQEITGTDDQYDMIYADDNAVIEINGGKFKCKTPKWTLNCKDGSNAKIIVKGGRFYRFDPSNAETGDGEIEVPNGYHVEKSGNDWFVVYSDDHIGEEYRKVVYGEGEYDYAIVKPLRNYPFKEACRKDNNVVLLASSMSTIDVDFAFGANLIIDCNGYKLTYRDGTPVMSKDGLTVLHNGAVA